MPPPTDPAAAASVDEGSPPAPPPAPRAIADSYAWRLMFSDGWAVVGLVFVILGAVFTLVGGALTLGIITALVGLPFLFIGLGFLGVGLALARGRYQTAKQVVNVLRQGAATVGQIEDVQENLAVRVNQRHPWTITYQFRLNGRDFAGRVSTLNPPGPALRPGRRASVLYLPDAPEHNVLYPHP